MIRFAVCDDSEFDLDLISCLLEQYLKETQLVGKVDLFSGGTDLLWALDESNSYDVVLLDIYMKQILGIEVARKLREKDFKGHILFLTGSEEYAVDGYEVEASGYLLKPHSYKRLKTVLDRLQLHEKRNIYTIKRRKEVYHIAYDEIEYIESENAKCYIHCTGGIIHTVYKQLKTIEKEIGFASFLRCHQSYLINMIHVKRVDDCFEMGDGALIPIRQKERKQIREKYLNFIM